MSTKSPLFNLKTLEKKYGQLTLSSFISSWRKAEGLSQKDFAEVIGISPANLCDIEKGRKGVSIYKATQIAKKIGYSPTVLVQLTLQELIESAGLNLQVEVKEKVG